jgi:ABC-type nickel/cobalt efflux system permease component RcnA/ABC-type uncharacterized transport system substrate-binding protein
MPMIQSRWSAATNDQAMNEARKLTTISFAKRRKWLALACLLAIVAVMATKPVGAHPHIWIEAISDVVFDDQGQVVAINHEWTMDEMYSEAAVDGLDTDGDGTYSASELKALTKENIASLKEFNYFTVLKAGAERVAFRDVAEAGQVWKDKRLKLHFQLPLEKPIDPRKTKVVYRVYDPEFFISIEFRGKESVFATGAIPDQCKVELQELVSDQQTEETKAMLATKGKDWQAPAEQDFGAMFARPVAVICSGIPVALPPKAVAQTLNLSERTLVPPKNPVSGTPAIPSFWRDPAGFVLATQQSFYRRISGAISGLRSDASWTAAWTLMFLSFGYGVFHAAGPGHGKTVISGWLLATEQQLRRGILISFASALIQATSAILIVSTLLFLVRAVGSTARSVASVLEAASYAMIALLGFYLLWQAIGMLWRSKVKVPGKPETGQNIHDHNCGHGHMPSARELDQNWSLAKAISISFAVGIRPCTGAILALLFANSIGAYWAGVAATFVMAIGTALTVSAIAIVAVLSKSTAMKMVAGNPVWLDWTAFGLRLAGGMLIAFLGTTLFVGSLNGVSTVG